MSNKTNYKCEECGSKDLLIPSWKTQDGMEDYPDSFLLNGDSWCNECERIVFVATQLSPTL